MICEYRVSVSLASLMFVAINRPSIHPSVHSSIHCQPKNVDGFPLFFGGDYWIHMSSGSGGRRMAQVFVVRIDDRTFGCYNRLERMSTRETKSITRQDDIT